MRCLRLSDSVEVHFITSVDVHFVTSVDVHFVTSVDVHFITSLVTDGHFVTSVDVYFITSVDNHFLSSQSGLTLIHTWGVSNFRWSDLRFWTVYIISACIQISTWYIVFWFWQMLTSEFHGWRLEMLSHLKMIEQSKYVKTSWKA